MKAIEGARILTYNQEAIVCGIEKDKNTYKIYLNKFIYIPNKNVYSNYRNFITIDEIQKYISY